MIRNIQDMISVFTASLVQDDENIIISRENVEKTRNILHDIIQVVSEKDGQISFPEIELLRLTQPLIIYGCKKSENDYNLWKISLYETIKRNMEYKPIYSIVFTKHCLGCKSQLASGIGVCLDCQGFNDEKSLELKAIY